MWDRSKKDWDQSGSCGGCAQVYNEIMSGERKNVLWIKNWLKSSGKRSGKKQFMSVFEQMRKVHCGGWGLVCLAHLEAPEKELEKQKEIITRLSDNISCLSDLQDMQEKCQ